MSKDYPTIAETEAYDRGFADAEDYWRPKEQQRIVKMLEEQREQTAKASVFANGPELRHELKTMFIALELAIRVINGED